jgi:DNA-directed RNA polymerase subunit L
MQTVEVVSIEVTRRELTAEAVPELRELFGLARLPLAPARITAVLRGVPTAVVNALRRVVTDEMPGRALRVPPDGFDVELTTDAFMLPQFVCGRIGALRLRPQIPVDTVAALRLELDVTNGGATPRAVYAGDLTVAAGAMPEPLFNPTAKLAVLQPGKRLVVRGIHVASGYGREHASFQVACHAAYTHLDLPQHTDAEMRDEKGVAVDSSGYKVSCLVADPRLHRLTATLPAATADPTEARAVLADACACVKERLRLIAGAVERPHPAGGGAPRGVQLSVAPLEGGLAEAVLQVPGETHTVGELLRRTIYELEPGVAFVAYVILPHEGRLVLTVRLAGDVSRALLRGVQHAIAVFDTLQRGIMAAL